MSSSKGRGFGSKCWHGPIDVVEQGTGVRVEALDASTIVASGDSRFDLTVDDAQIHIGASKTVVYSEWKRPCRRV
jgi:hypothetical protein